MRKLPSLATIMVSSCLSAHVTHPRHTEAATPVSETKVSTESASRAQALTECLERHFKDETLKQSRAYFKIDGDMVLVVSRRNLLSFDLPIRNHESICGNTVNRENYPFSHLSDNDRDGTADSFYRAGQTLFEMPKALDPSAQGLYESLLEKTLARCEAIQTEWVTQDTQNALSQSFRLTIDLNNHCSAFQAEGRFFTAAHCMDGDTPPTHLQWIAAQDASGVKSVYRSPSFALACINHMYYEDHAELALHPDLKPYLPEEEPSQFSGIIGNPFNATWAFEAGSPAQETQINNCDQETVSYFESSGTVDGFNYPGISGGPYMEKGRIKGINIAVNKSSGSTFIFPLHRVPECKAEISFEKPAQLERCAVTLKPGFVDGNGRMHKAAVINPESCETILPKPSLPHYSHL